MKKIFSVLAALSLVVVLLSGCGSDSKSDDNLTFKYSDGEIESFDTSLINYSNSMRAASNAFETLLQFNSDKEIVPAAANSFEISDDFLTYTFTLNEGMYWVNDKGEKQREIVAEDFVYSWKRTIDPATNSGYAYLFDGILNAEAASAGDVSVDEVGFNVVDDYTIEVTSERPLPQMQEIFAFPITSPQAKEKVEEFGQDYGQSNDSVWYNGPYYVSSMDKASKIVYSKNEEYHDKDNVQVSKIEVLNLPDSGTAYNSFKTGEIQYAVVPSSEAYQQQKAAGAVTDDLNSTIYYMPFNLQDTTAPIANKNLRLAMSYGFDREKYVELSVNDGSVATSRFIPDGFTMGSDGIEYVDFTADDYEWISYDHDKSQEYFAKAMSELGVSDPSKIEVELLWSETGNPKVSETVYTLFKNELGITVNVNTQPSASKRTMSKAGEYELTYNGWVPDFGDPGNFLGIFQSANLGSTNYPRLVDPAYDAAFEAASIETDVEKRFKMYAELENQIVNEDVAILTVNQENKAYLIADGYTRVVHPYAYISDKYITYTK